MTGAYPQTRRDSRTAPERTTIMNLPAASHRPARHTRRLPRTVGGLDDAHQFWPVRPLTNWASGDHHRHGKTRAQPYPLRLLEPGTGAPR